MNQTQKVWKFNLKTEFYTILKILTPICLVCLFLSSLTNSYSENIKIYPPELKIKIPLNKISDVPTKALYIKSNKDINDVSLALSDFHPLNSENMWISKSNFIFTPTNFNLTKGKGLFVNISFNVPNQTGSYLGTLTFSSPTNENEYSTLYEYFIFLEIFHPFPIYQFMAVTAGVILAFIIKNTKLRMQSRNILLESLEQCRQSLLKTISQRRLDNNFNSACNEISRIYTYYQTGDFDYTKKIFDNATELLNSAKEQSMGFQADKLVNYISGKMNQITTDLRTKKVLRSTLRPQNNIIFFLTSIVLGVIVIQTWLQLYVQVQSLSDSPIGYIVAFILGYGSQSLLGEAFEFKSS